MAKVPYASIIGSLMYVMVYRRPDIAYTMRVVSRFMSNPGKQHYEVVKWILRYLQGITEKCLCFRKGKLKLQGYVDANFFGEIDHMRNTTGYVFTLGGTTISQISQLQKIVVLSTTEIKHVVMIEASKEMIRLQILLAELRFKRVMNVLHSDGQSATQFG